MSTIKKRVLGTMLGVGLLAGACGQTTTCGPAGICSMDDHTHGNGAVVAAPQR